MAIQIYCTSKLPNGNVCKTSNSLESEKCSACGAVFNRKNRKYRVCVSVKGKRQNRIVDNLTIARETEAALKSDLIRGEFDITHHRVSQVPTLDDLWAKYLPWAKEHKKTWHDDEYHYHKHIEPRFGKKELGTITSMDIERMKMDLKRGRNKHGKPYAPATIKHQLILLKRLFNLAGKWGMYAGQNPMTSVEMPKFDNQITEFLTEEQMARLLQTLETWPCKESASFVKFAMYTGLRRGEIFKLTWSNIDFQHGMIALQAPKGIKNQVVPLSEQAINILHSLERISQFVFPGNGGGQRVEFKYPWHRIRKAAGLPEKFRFHGLRHNFASYLVSSGVDLAVVGELLTHKQASTTKRYAHFRPDVIKQAALRSGEILTPKKDELCEVVSISRSEEK